MEKKSMGTFLAALRKSSGMTQKQLADKLNVSDKAVSRWERDENAPDLSLIPVIAEVFGITSDELLRGERAALNTDPNRAEAKVEKQIRRILKDTLTKFKIRSAISVTVALSGLIAAMILNLGFLRAYVGFLVGCLFFLVAVLCQVIFLILVGSALDSEDMDDTLTAPVHKGAVYGSELVFGIIYLLLSGCLPLIILTNDTYMGLTARTWLEYGTVYMLLSLIPILITSTAVNLKLGYWTTSRFKTPIGKLQIRCTAVALAMSVLLGVAQLGLSWYLAENRQNLTDSYKFTNWEEFKKYMETPMDTVGKPMTYRNGYTVDDTMYIVYETENGTILNLRFDEILTDIYAHADDEEKGLEPLVQYRRLNMYVSSIEFSGEDDLLPVRVFTHEAAREANQKAERILLFYSILYPIQFLVAVMDYKKKKKAITNV